MSFFVGNRHPAVKLSGQITTSNKRRKRSAHRPVRCVDYTFKIIWLLCTGRTSPLFRLRYSMNVSGTRGEALDAFAALNGGF